MLALLPKVRTCLTRFKHENKSLQGSLKSRRLKKVGSFQLKAFRDFGAFRSPTTNSCQAEINLLFFNAPFFLSIFLSSIRTFYISVDVLLSFSNSFFLLFICSFYLCISNSFFCFTNSFISVYSLTSISSLSFLFLFILSFDYLFIFFSFSSIFFLLFILSL